MTIFINTVTNKRVNIYAPFTTPEGNRYANLVKPSDRVAVGVAEIVEPTPPQDYTPETYFRTETDDPPYVVYSQKPQEMIDAEHNARILAQIESLEISSKMNRTVREWLLDKSVKEAAALYQVTEEQAAAGLYQGNIAYRRFKDLDDQIAALRAQLR